MPQNEASSAFWAQNKPFELRNLLEPVGVVFSPVLPSEWSNTMKWKQIFMSDYLDPLTKHVRAVVHDEKGSIRVAWWGTGSLHEYGLHSNPSQPKEIAMVTILHHHH